MPAARMSFRLVFTCDQCCADRKVASPIFQRDFRRMQRFFHSTPRLWATFDKSLLGKLRKKTGYTFSNCKKALETCGNDMEKAEKWLHEQAKALGWAKATKLEGRATAQGLIGIASQPGKCVTMVEVNCETDFVARNKTFRSLVEQVTSACLQHAKSLPQASVPISKLLLTSEEMKVLPCKQDGGPLIDHVALAIGNVGENLSLRRCAILTTTEPLIQLTGYTHPAEEQPGHIICGKYGAMVAFKGKGDQHRLQLLGRQLCQHVVGMCPKSIGDPETDSPNPDSDSESVLIFQEFLLDSDLTVGNILQDNEATVLDYIRFETGETIES
ncbi:elongation factor Ts, mitochondrial [Neocloeon triangulifer]|uniref:elongation factor Ts, mitochondrial n=1 Tax=Neocloeon triangulifer TaxID=2078957 RepID=UPI00286F7C0C|nr:elongation factor Ts, mitochondrial [Neocloeon triangulifer]